MRPVACPHLAASDRWNGIWLAVCWPALKTEPLISKEAAAALKMAPRTFRRWIRHFGIVPDFPARPADGWKLSTVKRIGKLRAAYFQQLDALRHGQQTN